ncbi:Ig-like domain-containing protein [bacterium]|nr:Ig-like domain-containing protein [bacterium]
MKKQNRLEKWLFTSLIIIMVSTVLWITCTQKSPIDATSSLEEEIPLLTDITAIPNQIALGGSQSEIRVKLVDQEGDPLANEIVTFTTNLGTVTDHDTTDANGWARTILTSGQQAGQATIHAAYGKLASVFTSVNIFSSFEAQMQIEVEEESLLANGLDATNITVTVLSDSAEPVSGAHVSFTTTWGTIQPWVTTNPDGQGTVTLTSLASTGDTTTTVTATYDDLQVAVAVTFKGVQLSVTANPIAILADGESISAITAVLKETTSQIALSDETVWFASDIGLIPNSISTDSRGVAQVTITSSTQIGTAHVRVTYGNAIKDSVAVEFQSVTEVSYPIADISVSPSVLLANGVDQTTISVTVLDNDQKPVPNDLIRFVTTAGILESATAYTDHDGIATTRLTARASVSDSVAQVMAYRGLDIPSEQKTILFKGIQFTLSASPSDILADGQSTSTVTAKLKETTSQVAISGARIEFGTNLGLIANQATTNAQGVATVTLTSAETIGLAQVVAIYGQTHSDTIYVTYSSESATTRSFSELNANPNIILANGIDQSTVLVRVMDSDKNPVSGVNVNFTLSNSFGQIVSQGVTDAYGYATSTFTSDTSTWDVETWIRVQLGTLQDSVKVTSEGIQLDLEVTPKQIIANGVSKSSIKAILKRSESKIAISSGMISFASDLGTIPSQATTSSEGVAQVYLTSGLTVGWAHVVVRYGSKFEVRDSVQFQASVPTYIEASATPPILPADGQSQSNISVRVSDANRNPVPNNTIVLFELLEQGTGNRGMIDDSRVPTIDGVASNKLTSATSPGVDSIVVHVENYGSVRDTVEVVYVVGEASTVLVTSNKDSLNADGIETATIQARVMDAQGNPIQNVTVNFSTTIGDVTPSALTNGLGIAQAQFSSGVVGIAIITASVGGSVSGSTTIRLIPGEPNSIVMTFDPREIGVINTGQNQTAIIEADVRDSKNNPVKDGTLVTFSIYAGPGGGEFLSSEEPIPTVGGIARVSISSGTISGNVRIQAEVVDEMMNVIIAKASELLIHAGPAYMADKTDYASTHLTVEADMLNIWRALGTTQLDIAVFDKYHNPVQENTAVYLTTSGGGVSTHTAYTNKDGRATVILTGANPQPTINSYYNGLLIQDPNDSNIILPAFVSYPSPIDSLLLPNFEAYPVGYLRLDYTPYTSYWQGQGYTIFDPIPFSLKGLVGKISNSEQSAVAGTPLECLENDGIARIIAYTEGQDANGDPIRAWDQTNVIYSGSVSYEDNSDVVFQGRTLLIGQSEVLTFSLMDDNGNPITSRSTISASVVPDDLPAALNWEVKETGDGFGQVFYDIKISNDNQEEDKDKKAGFAAIKIKWENQFDFGDATTPYQIFISDTTVIIP